MCGRLRQTRRATGSLATVEGKGGAAARACRCTWKRKVTPAGRTQPVIRLDHLPAAGTARRQREVDQAVERTGEDAGANQHPRLSPAAGNGTSAGMDQAEIFDRRARRLRRDRAATATPGGDFLRAQMIEGIVDRLDAVARRFTDILDLGCGAADFDLPGTRIVRCDAGFGFARRASGPAVQADEDRLPFADASFDLVVSLGVLDSVNDLPGALALIRRVLRPDGLFLGAFTGAGSLPALRAALRAAEPDRPAPRLHPQVEVRAAGDLLMRAGFALPVADVEPLAVRYRDLGRLLDDLRAMAATNILRDRRALAPAALARAAAAFAQAADADGRTTETFNLVYLTGWAPDPSQPRPARRGSASRSLADALRPPGAPTE